jgi:hypothetical protein
LVDSLTHRKRSLSPVTVVERAATCRLAVFLPPRHNHYGKFPHAEKAR